MKIYGLRVDYSITAQTEPDGDFTDHSDLCPDCRKDRA